jgi:hypothetical protein
MKVSPAINPLYVEKKMISVHMYLVNGMQIKGFIHFAPRIRLTDTLNFQVEEKPFLPVSQAQIITQGGEEISVPFMLVNRGDIICCIPLKKLKL